MPAFLLILLGLVALVAGAELIVRCGSGLARRIGVPPLLVGLTVVSIGTSAPELAVGIDAVRSGAASLAIGNIAGTNVVNILLILGLSAVIRPLALQLQTLKLDLPAMATASFLVLLLALDGSFTVAEGVVLTVLAVVYTLLLLWISRRESAQVEQEFADEYPKPPRGRGVWVQLALLIVGLAVIVVGADWLVTGSTELASALGVSDALIGLTIVAIGTSAPEFATTIISTLRGDRDIAVGNLIGSSTFNLTLILGVSLLFAPGSVPVEPHLVMIDLPVMVLVALACIPVFLTGRRVSRLEGALFVAAYVVYLVSLVLTRG